MEPPSHSYTPDRKLIGRCLCNLFGTGIMMWRSILGTAYQSMINNLRPFIITFLWGGDIYHNMGMPKVLSHIMT